MITLSRLASSRSRFGKRLNRFTCLLVASSCLLLVSCGSPDLRAMIRRDRNHPSVFIWSIGNEIPEQTEDTIGAQAARIRQIANDEDPSRPTISRMNAANPDKVFADAMEAIGLNYQGSGVRDAPPEYPDFHAAYPDSFLIGTETTNTYSSSAVYTFPVAGAG